MAAAGISTTTSAGSTTSRAANAPSTANAKKWQEKSPTLCADLHDGGRVFKFRPDGRYAPGPLYIFNNSWYLRASLIKDGRLGYIGHWDNAIAFCRPEDYPMVSANLKPFFNGFLWDSDNYAFNHEPQQSSGLSGRLARQGYRGPWNFRAAVAAAVLRRRHGDLSLVRGQPGAPRRLHIPTRMNGIARMPPIPSRRPPARYPGGRRPRYRGRPVISSL